MLLYAKPPLQKATCANSEPLTLGQEVCWRQTHTSYPVSLYDIHCSSLILSSVTGRQVWSRFHFWYHSQWRTKIFSHPFPIPLSFSYPSFQYQQAFTENTSVSQKNKKTKNLRLVSKLKTFTAPSANPNPSPNLIPNSATDHQLQPSFLATQRPGPIIFLPQVYTLSQPPTSSGIPPLSHRKIAGVAILTTYKKEC